MSDAESPAVAPEHHPPFTTEEDRSWAAIAHLGGIVGIVPSLVIFLALRRRGRVTLVESKEALNWQITFLASWIVVDIVVLIVLGVAVTAALGPNGNSGAIIVLVAELIPAALWILNIVLSVFGFLAVNRGGSYRYPFAVRLIK